VRKTDIKHIFNLSWTRGGKIPRQVTVQGQSITVWFDPFCPKAVGLLGMNLPATLRGRSIAIKLWPKKASDKVENFNHADDEQFADLRSKLARWAADNAASLKGAKPLLPANFNNRLSANWTLLLAIAESAGGQWPKQARDAAERLARTHTKLSHGRQLVDAFRGIFASGTREISSGALVAELNSDPNSVWAEYHHGGPITQRQVAALREPYDIHPIVIHPTKRSSSSPRGYKAEQFTDVFARFPASDPHMRTQPRGKGRK
jgi:putative DNA primase/helicase